MATLLFTTCNCTAAVTTAHKQPNSSPSLSCPPHPQIQLTNSTRRSRHVARARRSGLSSRSRRLEKRTKKGGTTTTKEEEEEEEEEEMVGEYSVEIGGGGDVEYSKEPMPKLEGLEPSFWEGPQWNALGFFVEYLWAFSILFGLVACGVAVATYNEGAADFKKTTVYKESIQSRELLEEPDASTADVFEANPTETAPSLE